MDSEDARSGGTRVEQVYQRKDPREHVLLRPGMYVGATTAQPVPDGVWGFVSGGASGGVGLRPVPAGCTYVPALLKVFDEVLVNAMDNRTRDASMTRLDVRLDRAAGGGVSVSVWNNGRGIPVQFHTTERMYVPELVLGHLLTGSNFGDGDAAGDAAPSTALNVSGHGSGGVAGGGVTRHASAAAAAATTGGRHGYGAKLTNIFSSVFTVTTVDAAAGLLYRQTWRDNMAVREDPLVVRLSGPRATVGTLVRQGGGPGGSPQHEAATTSPSVVDCGAWLPPQWDGRDFTHVAFTPDMSRFDVTGGGASMAGAAAGVAGARSVWEVPDAAAPTPTDVTFTLMRRRVLDAAAVMGSKGVRVTLDGSVVPITSLLAYAQLHCPPPPPASAILAPPARALWTVHPVPTGVAGWELVVGACGASGVPPLLSAYDAPLTVSFVNGIATLRGGNHVTAVVDALAKAAAGVLAKAAPDLSVTPSAVKPHLRVWLSATIAHPTFDSQAKELLTTPRAKLFLHDSGSGGGSAGLTWSDKSMRGVMESLGLDDIVLSALRAKADAEAARALRRSVKGPEGRIKAIPKLEDANWAGTRRSHECTLIVTEGDSAKALAVAGLAVVGRDRYGVFPLRGKMLNVRGLALASAVENAEVQALITILGLDPAVTYAGADAVGRGLRYGRVMIMTDQDVDGAHIKGLLLNLFHTYWPHLLRHPNPAASFFSEFVTPVIKARRVGGGGTVREFFSVDEFVAWREEAAVTAPSAAAVAAAKAAGREYGECGRGGWSIKYYKGLGTSTSDEARAYFSRLDKHVHTFTWAGEGDDGKLLLAFGKDQVVGRKQWLSHLTVDGAMVGATVPTSTPSPTPPPAATGAGGTLSYSTFVDGPLIAFSQADLVRSLPSVLDGLKPSQRKVLYACFKRQGSGDGMEEVKVAQLAGYVAEVTSYHHGEASLVATIVNMAQDFVAANNVPLLQPLGQFGTRLQGGKDAASARYIYTRLSPLARALFPSLDDELLRQRDDDGYAVEPVAYVPIIPAALLNGSAGIGTGWSTVVPPYHPLTIIDGVRRMIEGYTKLGSLDALHAPPAPLTPHWRGFAGRITQPDADTVVTHGVVHWVRPETRAARGGTTRASKGGGGAPSHWMVVTSDGRCGGQLVDEEELDTIRITDLPIGRWTEDFKAALHDLVSKGVVKSVAEHHTERAVDFVITLSADGMAVVAGLAKKTGRPVRDVALLESWLKLTTSISLRNMHLFDVHGRIRRYATPGDLMHDHFAARWAMYAARRRRLQFVHEEAVTHTAAKHAFLHDVVAGTVALHGKPKASVVADLWQRGYPAMASKLGSTPVLGGGGDRTPWPADVAGIAHLLNPATMMQASSYARRRAAGDGPSAAGTMPSATGFDYLLSAPVSSLTSESLAEAEQRMRSAQTKLRQLLNTSVSDMWLAELDALEQGLVAAGWARP